MLTLLLRPSVTTVMVQAEHLLSPLPPIARSSEGARSPPSRTPLGRRRNGIVIATEDRTRIR